MIGKNFVYNNVAIPYTTTEGRLAGWYADVNWTGMPTRNIVDPREDFHGSISRPTFADGKVISITGQIFSTVKVNRGTAKNIVANLFKVADFPDETNELKKLEFTDDDNTDWYIMAKPYTMPEYTHERANPIISFSTQLFAPDPVLLSQVLKTANGIYGLWGGVTLPTELPVAFMSFDSTINSFTCTNDGNFAAKTKIIITGDIKNPRIYNLTTGRFFQVLVDMTGTDELIIDSENNTIELNGTNVSAYRGDGSNWLFVASGINYFLLTGEDFDYDDYNKAEVEVQWRDTKLV